MIVRVRGLTNRFGDKTVHEDLDLDVKRGEVLGVIGGSGTGKSVLLRSIVGLHAQRRTGRGVRPEARQSFARQANVERRWGVMFQDGAFARRWPAARMMAPMVEHTKIPDALMRELADLNLRRAGLELEAAPKRPADLSGACASELLLRGPPRSIRAGLPGRAHGRPRPHQRRKVRRSGALTEQHIGCKGDNGAKRGRVQAALII